MKRVAVPTILCLLLLTGSAHAADEADLPAQREELRAARVAELVSFASDAASRGYRTLARRCLEEAARAGGTDAELAAARAAAGDADDDPKLKDSVRGSLEKKLTKLRSAQAGRLGALAKLHAEEGLVEDSAALARAAVRLDPDRRVARRVLGQEKVPGWGWVPAADAEQLGKGLLPYKGEWRKSGEVVRLRKAWREAWVVESAHFRVRSNLPLGRVFELRDLLESYHALWTSHWGGFLPPVEEPRLHDVLIFAKELEYRDFLAATDPGHIKGVPGQYSPMKKRSAFFDVESLRTASNQTSGLAELMLHECTHQLMREAVGGRSASLEETDPPNFWVHEGLAEFYGMHVPTRKGLVLEKKRVKGQLRALHLKRNMSSVLAVPKLDEMRRKEFEGNGNQRLTNYVTAGFLVMFLEQGKYRPGLRRLVREAYCGENPPGLMKKRVAPDTGALDREFRKFLKGF